MWRKGKIKYISGSFYLSLACKCDRDGTNNCTMNKLLTKLSQETAEKVFSEVQKQRKKGLPNTVDYWKNLGYSQDEAVAKVLLTQNGRSKKAAKVLAGTSNHTMRSYQFWMNKGLSLEEATEKVRKIQTTNGLNFYIDKYGEVDGPIKFNQRIEQWLDSAGNKKMVTGRSGKSAELFSSLPVDGYYGENEKVVRGKIKVHRVDFLYEKKIIEFYGDYWHGNPIKYNASDMVRRKTVLDIWKHDQNKNDDLMAAGYKVLIIWEFDYHNARDKVIKICEDFLNES